MRVEHIAAAVAVCCSLAGMVLQAVADPTDLGKGFVDFGVAAPISNHRGAVATVDGQGRNVLLLWLMDHRGGYELLLIDAGSGKAEEFPMPFANLVQSFDAPYSSILSSDNKFYTHFNSFFVEFDPARRAFTFSQKTTPQMAMSMTEDDRGVIWSVTYPQSGVVSFNPKSRELRDYGQVYPQNWPEYPRFVAADDAGWIYFGLGTAASQIVMLDPGTGKATAMLAEPQRSKGTAYVYRDLDGKVYGQALRGPGEDWLEFYKGESRKLPAHDTIRAKPIVTGDQGLFHAVCPDGSKVQSCDLVERKLVIEGRGGEVKELAFDYHSDGAIIMGVAAAPDGTPCGGTTFPMRFFSLDPKTGKLSNRAAYGQWNTVARQGDRFFAGGYGGGFLLEWDPAKPWVPTVKGQAGCNPAFLIDCDPDLHRPARLLAHPDGNTLIMGGTPQYGYTGGGLLFWDRAAGKGTLLSDTQVIPQQSTVSLLPLPQGKLLGGTTTSPGTGGERKATQAELYIMDMASKRMDWHAAVFPGVQEYIDVCHAPGGLIFGLVDQKLFFVFDPARRAVIHQQDVSAELGPSAYQQGPRVFIPVPSGEIYMLFRKGIVRVDNGSYKLKMLAESPVPIEAGGDYLDGWIYFVSGSHLCAYRL